VASDAMEIVVLTDQQGNYYALPRQTLEQARVPEAHRQEIEELTQTGETGGYGQPDSGLQQVGSISVPPGLKVSNMQASWSAE
jgi:hypothetical protein